MWRYENIDAKLACPFRCCDELGVNQYARLMRIADDLLFELITALRIKAGDLVAESMRLQTRGLAPEITFLFVKERFAICDQELGIANLRAIDCGVIDFGKDAHRHRKPDPAGRRIRGSNAILRAGCPCRINAGRSESAVVAGRFGSHERRGGRPRAEACSFLFSLFSYIFPSSAEGP